MGEQSTIYENRDSKEILKDKLISPSGTLADFFEISNRALEGGMGEVFFCRDKRDNRFYVLKTFNAKSKDIFKQEARFALDLDKNPYIVYTKTIISDNSKYYVVMEYIGKQPYSLNEEVKGETLSQVLKKHGARGLEPKQALIWAIQFCKGMVFLNNSGMETHKDVKPDNILISPDNIIKITDFGLASIGKKGGTIGYRPPEYFDDKKDLTIQSDIYSFGLVLYQMFNSGNLLSAKTTFNSEKKEYEFVDENNLKSNHCQDIIKKCLQKDPNKRYKNFEELEKDLTAYLKQNYPEYQLPNLKAEEMSANDYFFKGLGYYVLNDKLSAFSFYSKAILKDKQYASPYYFRYLLFNYIPAPFIAIAGFLTFILALIIYNTVEFATMFCNYKIGLTLICMSGLALMLFFIFIVSRIVKLTQKYYFNFLYILLLPLIYNSIIFKIAEWKYINYLSNNQGIIKTLLSEKTDVLIYAIIAIILLSLVIFCFKKTFSVAIRHKRLMRYIRRILLPSILQAIYTFFTYNDSKKAFELDRKYYYWDIIQNQSKYPIDKVVRSYEKIESLGESLPEDFMLYNKIKLAMHNKNFQEMNKLCHKFKKQFTLENSPYWIDVALSQTKTHEQEQDLYDILLKHLFNGTLDINLEDNFITNIYIYPKSGINSNSTIQRKNLIYALLAWYEKESGNNKGKYLFERAELRFLLAEWEKSLQLYEQLIKLDPIDFDVFQKEIDESIKMIANQFPKSKNTLTIFKEKIGFNIKDVWIHIGATQYYTRKFKDAFNSFSKAIELNPKDKRLYHYRAKCAIPAHIWIYKGIFLDSLYSYYYETDINNII